MSDEKPTSQACVEIFAWANEVLGRKEVGTANRCSSAPGCVRKRWFQNQGVPGEPMQPRSLLVFATGDLIEHVMKYLILNGCVGEGKLYSEVDFGKKTGTFIIQNREFDIYTQDDLVFEIGGTKVSGHPDGWGKRNSDGQWELIEIKSSSSYGFDDFVRGDCGYLKQANALLMSPKAFARKVTAFRFFYMNKNTSDIFDRVYEQDLELQKKIALEFLMSNDEVMPSIPIDDDIGPQQELYRNKPTGNVKLGWKCSYCEYNRRCFPHAQIEFKNGKPVYYINKE